MVELTSIFTLYYKRDKEAGILTDEKASELQNAFAAMVQFIDLYLSPTGGAFIEGYAHWEVVTIAVRTKDGSGRHQ